MINPNNPHDLARMQPPPDSGLGYAHGNDFGDPNGFTRGTGEDEINRFNVWMRSQPWHQEFIRSIGQDPNHINLSEKQQKQLADIARANGVPMPKDFSPDAAGNLNQNSRTNRNIAIGLAIAGGAFAAPYIIGAMSAAGAGAGSAGAAGAGAGAGAGAAGTGGALASTAIGSGFAPAIAGGAGISSAGIGGAAATGGALASTQIGSGLSPAISGGTGISSATAGGGTLSTASNLASKFYKNGGSNLLSDSGQAIGNATTAAGNNRLNADAVRERGQRDFEAGLENRSELEAKERLQANKDAYRASWYQNRQAGPNNTAGLSAVSPAYMDNLSALEKQALEKLSKPAVYGTSAMPELKPFTPTPQSGMEKAGSWVGPALTIASRFFRK